MAFRQELRTALHTAVPLFVTAAGLLGLIHLTGSTAVTVALSTVVCIFMAFLSSFWAIPTDVFLGGVHSADGVGIG